MTSYYAHINWTRQPHEAFIDNHYSRLHQWTFDEGISIPASSSPHSVPLPLSVAAAVDPEEALVAAVASCHMLWFLGIAAKKGFKVNAYTDTPEGIMAKNQAHKMAITDIYLRPQVTFSGPKSPDAEMVTKLHDLAHQSCYIANSILATIHTEGGFSIEAS
ncbi:MAG: OsmC family protein [Neisseriaceae bacterium]|nr:OsmC family protein [Neisseriaceae bacterium]MBP6861326.1 OsmC family protein [Neisseriaceae bacterium]